MDYVPLPFDLIAYIKYKKPSQHPIEYARIFDKDIGISRLLRAYTHDFIASNILINLNKKPFVFDMINYVRLDFA